MINSIKGFKESSIGSKVLSERIKNEDGSINWDKTDEAREDAPIFVDHDVDMISFKMMTKPVSEGGKGCQLTDLIEVALYQLKYLNDKFPCREDAITITKLEEAMIWQRERARNRVERGVEGKNEA